MSSKQNTINPVHWLNSMTVRLTVLVVLTSVLILLLMTSAMKQYLSQTIRQEEIRFLSDTAYVLQDIFQRQESQALHTLSPLFTQQLNQEIKTAHFSKLELLIETQKHEILLKTPEFNKIPPQLFTRAFAQDQGKPIEFSWNRHDYLLDTRILEHPKVQLYLVLDITHNNRLIYNFERKLDTVVFLGVLGTLVLGLLVTYLGLFPLREISREVSAISPMDLDKRIDRPAWPRELRRLAISFDDMLARTQRAFQQISQFSADVAHEFRTPITNLKGETEVALRQTRTPEEYQDLLHSQLEEYDRLTRMIDKLLFLARTEAQETRLQCAQFYVGPEIRAVIEYFEPLIQEKQIQIQVNGNAILNADQSLFRRAISNLLANALKYAAVNGRIDIETKPLADLSIQITVKDTGCGIAPEHLEHIFDRFYRVDSVRQHQEGTGLGLSIVQSIMTIHGGTIKIESAPGQGTSAILNFPGV